jgi:hypothetical protein
LDRTRALIARLIGTASSLPPVAAGAQTARSFSVPQGTDGKNTKAPIVVQLYADGNIRKALQDAGGGQVAAGSLGLTISAAQSTFDILLNTAGSTDALRRGFGTSVLAPGSGGNLSSGLIDWRLFLDNASVRRKPGIRAYASASSVSWQPDTAKSPVSAAIGGLGLGVFYGIGGRVQVKSTEDSTKTENKVISAVLDLGVAYRSIGGDVVLAANEAARGLVGADNVKRAGLELGATLVYSGLKAGVTYYVFGGDMPGYSHGQLVAAFAVQTILLGGHLYP